MRCAQAQENFQHPNEDTDTTAQHSSNNGGGASWQRGEETETQREAAARKKEKKTGQEKSIKRRNNFLPPFCLLRLVLLRLRNFHSWLIRKVSSLLHSSSCLSLLLSSTAGRREAVELPGCYRCALLAAGVAILKRTWQKVHILRLC